MYRYPGKPHSEWFKQNLRPIHCPPEDKASAATKEARRAEGAQAAMSCKWSQSALVWARAEVQAVTQECREHPVKSFYSHYVH